MDIFPAAEVKEKNGRLGIDVGSRYGEDFQTALKKYKGFVQLILQKPEKPATEKQNRMFHGLLSLYWRSRIHSYQSYDDMRETIKIRYGVVLFRTILGEDYQIIVSWSKYNMRQRSKTIDGLKAEMEEAGILSSAYGEEYQAILKGVEL